VPQPTRTTATNGSILFGMATGILIGSSGRGDR
jgi:hypothetical protein